MDTIDKRPPIERLRSFNPLASIYLYRLDLNKQGFVGEETKSRVSDEELTFVAEGIDRPLQTKFVLQEMNGELVYFDKGEWRPYITTLTRGLRIAKLEADVDPRKAFLVDKAANDLTVGYGLESLKVGQTLIWDSRYPQKEENLYGAKFVNEQGFQSKRKMGFLYRAQKLSDGSLELVTQSVDNSDDDAFEAVAVAAALNPDMAMDDLMAVYDSALVEKYEDQFYAGRRLSEHVSVENAWDAINRNQDLVQFYLSEIEMLAMQADMPERELELAKKRLTYGFWAALKGRLDQVAMPTALRNTEQVLTSVTYTALRREVNMAYQQAAKKGEILFGCGGVIEGEDEESILNASPEEVFNSIFGSSEEILRCVTCPECGQEVDAKIKHQTRENNRKVKVISCPQCKASKEYDE